MANFAGKHNMAEVPAQHFVSEVSLQYSVRDANR
jgi:hypothetical protein